MEVVNILDARNNLSRLVAKVGNGAEVVIANRGKPVARLVPFDSDAPEHTASRAVEWLARHPVPTAAVRTSAEIDDQIAAEREGWE